MPATPPPNRFGVILYDEDGNPQNLATAARTTQASISISTSGDNSIVGAVAGQTTRVHRIFLVAAGAVNITFKDGASTSLTGALSLPAAGAGMVFDFSTEPWFVTSANSAFIINLSAAVQVSGRIYYSRS